MHVFLVFNSYSANSSRMAIRQIYDESEQNNCFII